jgi:hypothetical protein
LKYFIEFLLEKQIISPGKLLEAVLEQGSLVPSIPEIAFKCGILSEQQILEALVLKGRDSTSFQEACETLGFWSQDIANRIQSEAEKLAPPLTQILIQKSMIDSSHLTNALEQYLQSQNHIQPTQTQPVRVQPTQVQANEVKVSLPPFQAKTLPLTDLLPPEWIHSIQEITHRAETTSPESSSILKQLLHDFHKLKGIARLSNCTKLESLASNAENLLQIWTERKESMTISEITKITEALRLCLDLALRLRDVHGTIQEDDPNLNSDCISFSSQLGLLPSLFQPSTNQIKMEVA